MFVNNVMLAELFCKGAAPGQSTACTYTRVILEFIFTKGSSCTR